MSTRTHGPALPLLAALATLGALACAPAAQQADPGAAAANGINGAAGGPAIDPTRISLHVRTLASDEYLGRGPATEGEEKTVTYIASQFRLAGLQPGGPNGGWYQEVPLNQYTFVGTPRFELSTGQVTRQLQQGEQVAVRANMQNIAGGTFSGPLVFLGYGVKAPERNWDDFKGQDLKGKVGVVLINDPDFETGQGDFGGKAMTYYGRWTYKYEEAARQGLTGLLIVHETAPASYGWATVKNSNTNTMFDIVRADPKLAHPPIEGWIQRDVAVEVFRSAGLDFEALKRQAQSRDFRPVPIGDATFAATFQVKYRTIRSRNVVARLVGRTRPDETILYGAHWDHLGVGAPDARGDSIYNGAVDNATGVAAVLELARALAAGPRPERSIVFAAWTAEEKGLLGSEYYASNPVYPLETTVAGFNIDALSPTGPSRDVLVVGYGQSELEDQLERALATSGRVIARDPHPEAGYFYRSDHFPMAKRGVPMLYIDSGQDLVVGGTAAGEAADAAYRRDAYHQPADQYDAGSWRFDGIAQEVGVLRQLGLELANSTTWPNYRTTSEFRPVRDASAARRR